MGWRWTLHLLHVPEHGRARGHVFLLPDVLHGARGPEVPVVEEVHHQHAAASVCHLLHPWQSSPLHGL